MTEREFEIYRRGFADGAAHERRWGRGARPYPENYPPWYWPSRGYPWWEDAPATIWAEMDASLGVARGQTGGQDEHD